MRVTVRYHAQVRYAAGTASDEVEAPPGATVRDLPQLLAARGGEALRAMLLAADGRPQPSVLWFVGDEQVDCDSDRPLRDGDVVEVLTPIAGG